MWRCGGGGCGRVVGCGPGRVLGVTARMRRSLVLRPRWGPPAVRISRPGCCGPGRARGVGLGNGVACGGVLAHPSGLLAGAVGAPPTCLVEVPPAVLLVPVGRCVPGASRQCSPLRARPVCAGSDCLLVLQVRAPDQAGLGVRARRACGLAPGLGRSGVPAGRAVVGSRGGAGQAGGGEHVVRVVVGLGGQQAGGVGAVGAGGLASGVRAEQVGVAAGQRVGRQSCV